MEEEMCRTCSGTGIMYVPAGDGILVETTHEYCNGTGKRPLIRRRLWPTFVWDARFLKVQGVGMHSDILNSIKENI